MNKEMIELYSNYLIGSFGQATGLSVLVGNDALSHDKVTLFLPKDAMFLK